MKYAEFDPLSYDIRRMMVMDNERDEVKQAISDAVCGRVVWENVHPKRVKALIAAAKREDDVKYVWFCPDAYSIVLTSVEAEAIKVIECATESTPHTFNASDYAEFGDSDHQRAMWSLVVRRVKGFTREEGQYGKWSILVDWKRSTCRLMLLSVNNTLKAAA